MKRKKTALKAKGRKDIYSGDIVNISREEKEYFFDIGSELTSDIAEAVALMMRKVDWQDDSWDIAVSEVKFEEITPEKSLFWLTGGPVEWNSMENYSVPWCDCYLEFQEEFGMVILDIIRESKTLRDIRDGYCKRLNLQSLYEFALSRGFVHI